MVRYCIKYGHVFKNGSLRFCSCRISWVLERWCLPSSLVSVSWWVLYDFKNPWLYSFSLAGICGYVETKGLISDFFGVFYLFFIKLYFVLEYSWLTMLWWKEKKEKKQCCDGFSRTAKGLSHTYTCIHSFNSCF